MRRQVASCPSVTVISADDVDKEMLERERQIELQKEDLQSKPQAIRCALQTQPRASYSDQALLL